MKRGALLDENCPLEDAPQERFDAYGFGKLKQEELVKEYGEVHNLPYVILRPGYVFGPGKRELNGRVGTSAFGLFIQVNGSQALPLTFVDNCAEAVVLAGLKPGIDGEIFNVVDDELLTGRQFLKAYKSEGEIFSSIRVPYIVGYAMSLLWEKYSKWSKNQLPPVFNRRRCAAEWKGNRYSNQKLKERLGWKPKVPMEQAMALFLGQFESNGDSHVRITEYRGRTAGNLSDTVRHLTSVINDGFNQSLNVKGSEPLTLNHQPRARCGSLSSAAARSRTSTSRRSIGFRTAKSLPFAIANRSWPSNSLNVSALRNAFSDSERNAARRFS